MHELVECLLSQEFDSFRDRLQSFIDQIPKVGDASSAPSREGFFEGFFLGMFGSLRSVGNVEGFNNTDEISFNIDNVGRLRVGIINGDDRSGGHLSRFSFLIDTRRNVDPAERRAFRGEFNRGRNLSNVTCVINNEGQLEVSNAGPIEDPLRLRSHSVMSGERVFGDLSNCIFEMGQGGDQAIVRSREFFNYATGLYRHLRGLLGNNRLFDLEAFQHGFLVGILMNFRYRLNLRPYIEIISGRGYADIFLLIRGDGRSFESTPMIVELKTGSVRATDGRDEARWYARALRINKMRMLTDATRVLCVGLNMLNNMRAEIIEEQIRDPDFPSLRRLISLAVHYRDEGEEEGQRRNIFGVEDIIRQLVSEVYYSFPCTQDTHNHLSRFFLGQAIITNALHYC